jgi:hypothetical protein
MAHRKNPKTMATSYRVYRLAEKTRTRIKEAREKRGQTVQQFVADSIASQLSKVADGLAALKVAPVPSDARPARLPMDDATLAALKESSVATGIPQATLLVACLELAAERKGRKRSG